MEYTPHTRLPVRSRLALVSILGLAASLGLNAPVSATDFEYVRIASTSDSAPGTTGTYGAIQNYDFDGTNIVFYGANALSMFVRTPAGTSLAVSNTTPLPGWSGTGNILAPSISGTDIGFLKAQLSTQALYVTRNGTLTLLANQSTPVPGGVGNFQSFLFGSSESTSPFPSVNSALSNGRVVFGGASSTGGGLYYADTDGSLHRIVDATTATKNFSGGSVKGDHAVFVGGPASNQLGIYRYSLISHTLDPIVAPGTTLPVNSMSDVFIPPTISGENVAFLAGSLATTTQAVYFANSNGVQLLAATGMQAPGSTSTFGDQLGSGGVTISGSSVAFSGDTKAGTIGVYTTFGGSLVKVVDSNAVFDGSTFTTVVGVPKISGSNILFSTNRGLYMAMGEHHWANAGGGSWDTAANWSFGLAPRALIPTFVDPANGALITGPTGNLSLKALTIGAAQSGIAELQLQASGQINVNGPVTITSRGRLDVAGTLSATGAVANGGVIAGSGQVVGQLINQSSGEVRVTAGQSLRFSGMPGANAGAINVTGGEIEFSNGLVNQPSTGIITARDGTLRFGFGLTNAGSVALAAGTTDVYGDILNTGSITITGGTGGGTQTAIFHDDVVQNGTLTVSAAGQTRSVVVFLGAFSGAGGISGAGDVFFEGDLRPGNSPASVRMNTNVAFGPQAHLVLELGGVTLGTQYDHLTFGGMVNANGALQISLVNGFVPQAGNSFDLFDFEGSPVTGTFSSINLPSLQPGLSWNTSAMLTNGTISVVPEASAGLFAGTGSILLVALYRRRNRSSGACSPS